MLQFLKLQSFQTFSQPYDTPRSPRIPERKIEIKNKNFHFFRSFFNLHFLYVIKKRKRVKPASAFYRFGID